MEQEFTQRSDFLLNMVLPQMKRCARHGTWGGIKEHNIFVYKNNHRISINIVLEANGLCHIIYYTEVNKSLAEEGWLCTVGYRFYVDTTDENLKRSLMKSYYDYQQKVLSATDIINAPIGFIVKGDIPIEDEIADGFIETPLGEEDNFEEKERCCDMVCHTFSLMFAIYNVCFLNINDAETSSINKQLKRIKIVDGVSLISNNYIGVKSSRR